MEAISTYDVIVVGAGHAGSEAAGAAAAAQLIRRVGKTLLITMFGVSKMSAIHMGGVAKGQLIRKCPAIRLWVEWQKVS